MLAKLLSQEFCFTGATAFAVVTIIQKSMPLRKIQTSLSLGTSREMRGLNSQMMTDQFYKEKALRAEHFFRFVYGWKQRNCCACNGSGYYDNNGSPCCGSCEGTGREKYRGPKCTDDAMDTHAPGLVKILSDEKDK